MAEQKAADKVPVTVVTGFLGSGKTTLVNRILTENHGKKIAVIENEFGEVGIDDGLVLETKEEIFEMNNGCICCTVRGDLIRIMTKLLKRKNKLDAILIETTGLANPAPVIQTFFVDETIKDACFLDAVLTLVDVKHILIHLDEEKPDGIVNEAVQQIAFADKILLNKVDLVKPEEKQAVIRRIKNINVPVQIIECEHAAVDLGLVLGIKAFSLDLMLEKDPMFLGAEDNALKKARTDDHGHEHKHDHGHEHGHKHAHGHEGEHKHAEHAEDQQEHGHKHDHGHEDKHEHGHDHVHDHVHDDRVTSVGIMAAGQCDMQKLNDWLSKLLQERGADLFRSKGILSVAGTDHKHVFQGVHMLLQFSTSADGAGRPWQAGEARINKLVFIGKNLDREELTSSFKACLTTPETPIAPSGINHGDD